MWKGIPNNMNRINRGIKFKQFQWMEPYITFNTNQRKQARSCSQRAMGVRVGIVWMKQGYFRNKAERPVFLCGEVWVKVLF